MIAALAGLMLAGGCGPQVTAPSLRPRAVEKQPIDLPAEESEAQTPADPALIARTAPILAAAEKGHAAFEEERGRTESVVTRASGQARESEPWIAAQEAVSALDASRGAARDAAQAIDDLRQEPAAGGSGSRAALDAAATRVSAIEQNEADAVAALSAKLG